MSLQQHIWNIFSQLQTAWYLSIAQAPSFHSTVLAWLYHAHFQGRDCHMILSVQTNLASPSGSRGLSLRWHCLDITHEYILNLTFGDFMPFIHNSLRRCFPDTFCAEIPLLYHRTLSGMWDIQSSMKLKLSLCPSDFPSLPHNFCICHPSASSPSHSLRFSWGLSCSHQMLARKSSFTS